MFGRPLPRTLLHIWVLHLLQPASSSSSSSPGPPLTAPPDQGLAPPHSLITPEDVNGRGSEWPPGFLPLSPAALGTSTAAGEVEKTPLNPHNTTNTQGSRKTGKYDDSSSEGSSGSSTPPAGVLGDAPPSLVTRREVTPESSSHRHRHRHAAAPLWLRHHLKAPLGEDRRLRSNTFEEEIAEVFRGVAYRGSTPYRSLPVKRQGTRKVLGGGGGGEGGSRIERTTAVSEEPWNDYLDDKTFNYPDQRNQSVVSPSAASRPGGGAAEGDAPGKDDAPNSSEPQAGEAAPGEEGTLLQLKEYDPDTYDLYDGHYDHLATPDPDPDSDPDPDPDSDPDPDPDLDPKQEGSVRGEAPLGVTSQWQLTTNGTEAADNTTSAPPRPPRQPSPRLSWFDALRCTNRSLAWILVNLFLGLVLLCLSLLGPYRLLTLRCCSPLLPRTHYVAVHLLVFVATSLKAVYLFHLAFGSRGRLPLILVLLLTNTAFPCYSSAFVVLMIMMFLTADVQIYKSKLFTVHNTFIFIVMKLTLCFVADVIVGCAHSRSVLVLSRVMVVLVVAGAVLVYARKHQAVLHVSHMMKREFQGELKLLVLPAKDESQQKQMGIKHILRNRLGLWCRAMKVSAGGLALLSFVHLLHTVFLVSSHVPVWAWWVFHVAGCLLEVLLAVSTCVAAALTQRYDESVSFSFSFLVPPVLVRRKGAAPPPPPGPEETIYQRVSFSSGTESTQYTACCPEAALAAGDAASRTPLASRRRGASVKRSATFSHTPHIPYAPAHLFNPALGPLQVGRVGSASHLPIYGPPAAGSHRSIYGPSLVSHIPVYSPPSEPSVLVHEDGFVRIRQTEPCEALRPHGSLIMLQQAHFRGSNPHIRGPEIQELNGLGRQEVFYQSLSRRRRGSRGPDLLQNNISMPESDYHSSPSSRRSLRRHSNLPAAHPRPHSPHRDELDFRSLSRRRSSREPRPGPLSTPEAEGGDYYSLSRRRRAVREGRDPRLLHLNNLDRPEGDQRSLTRRQVSREDNNDPVHLHHLDADHYADRRTFREPRPPTLNLYEEQSGHPRPSMPGESPTPRRKVTNHPLPSPPSPADHHSGLGASPRSRRQALFPKPFVRAGSNRSLQGDDDYYTDYVPRGNPVRRNHSSAGYYPSRYIAPPSPSLTDAHRYGSLRLGKTRKRQHNYVLSGGGKLLNRDPDPRENPGGAFERGPSREDNRAALNGLPEGGEPRDCPSRQSTSSKRSDGTDQDWATELIKSSSILTDFYSLTPEQKAAKRKDKIVEEQEDQ